MVAVLAAIILGVVLYFTFLSKKNEGKYKGVTEKIYNFFSFNKFYTEEIMKLLYIVMAAVLVVVEMCIRDRVNTVPEEYFLEDTEDLLDELDPRGDRMNTFYIYDEFSLLLGEYRAKKREYELMIRKEQKQTREQLRREHGVQLTPKRCV